MGGNGGGVAPARCLEWCAGATHIGWAYRSAAGSIGPRPTRRLSVGAMTTTTPLAAPQSFYVMQDLVTLHARYEQTGGGFFAMEVEVPPEGGPPPLHTHSACEFFWTLEGQLTYFRDDGDEGITEITGGPGTSAFIPGGVAHTYRNFSDAPARYLGVLSPPELMQDFLIEAGVRPGEELRGPEEVLAIGERFGLVILDVVPTPRG
jgi:mannose-6-phosphate isomerase-like protein (cupin superfamily)